LTGVLHLGEGPTWVIADSHLGVSSKEVDALIALMESAPVDLSNFVVLGDLFDAWIGPETVDFEPLAKLPLAFRNLAEKGVRIFLVRGNRDVLLRKEDGALFSATVADQLFWGSGENQVLLSHGDEYCVLDKSYQRLRRFLRSRFIRHMLLALPVFLRHRLARKMRSASRQAISRKPLDMMALEESAVASALRQAGVQQAWMGHLHVEETRTIGPHGKLQILPAWEPGCPPKELGF